MITDNLCLPGYMCPIGSKSAKELACPPGTYQSDPGQDSCNLCPAGKYCPYQTVWPIPCPAGYYCYGGNVDPTHADNFPVPCAKGTFGSRINLLDPSECETCPAGFYCAEEGADSPTGLCDAGFICTGGDDNPQPVGGECPAGGYCERGSVAAKSCNGGFYNPSTGKSTIFDCVQCPPGEYCAGDGGQAPTDYCADGFYCESASQVNDQF